jgi:hypothetical protein
MKTLFTAVLAAIILSVSGAHSAEREQGERKRPGAQTQKAMKPAQRLAILKRNIAESASKTAAIIRTNAAKLRQSVWPDPRAAEKARKDKLRLKDAKVQPIEVD